MNKLITITLFFFAILAVSCKQKATPNIGEAAAYTCPMHPTQVSVTPGVCPVCKMALMPMEKAAEYTCPMHPEVKSDQPGTCPECKMDLEKVKTKE